MGRSLFVAFVLVMGCGGANAAPASTGTVIEPTAEANEAPPTSTAERPHKKHVAKGNDRDGDGIADSVDSCPDAPEDYDGFLDDDGCPDPDNDQDGIPDANDKCPNNPETLNGYQDDDGCPDKVGGSSGADRDGDGIPDANDKCPDEPEDRDGFEDADGCPDPDNDKDGILDVNDKCPNVPGPASKGGCP